MPLRTVFMGTPDFAVPTLMEIIGHGHEVLAAYTRPPQPVLAGPPQGCLNVHASLLPRWRGAAPIQRAILAGDAETGVSIMQMDEGLDTGPVFARRAISLGPADDFGSVHDKLAELGADLLLDVLSTVQNGTARATPQLDDGATYAAKISAQWA